MSPRTTESGGSSGSSTSSSSLQWFVRHPLLSSVVWIFGGSPFTDEVDYDLDSVGSRQNSKQRLSWSDQHGKSLTQVLGNEESAESQSSLKTLSMTSGSLGSMPDSALRKRSPKQDGSRRGSPEPVGDKRVPAHPHEKEKMVDENGDVVDEDEDFLLCPENKSPQWGWYVTMTPPQEHYPVSAAQASHRRLQDTSGKAGLPTSYSSGVFACS